jgi:Rab proteins geranylgeranyltransferase component A
LSLQEAEAWAKQHQGDVQDQGNNVFSRASIHQPEPDADTSAATLSFPRAYSLALAPQIIHAKSDLLSQLVTSRAYRQIEFLAVGPFFVLKNTTSSSSEHEHQSSAQPTLIRIPSTREDVFSSTALSARSKRALMKFLKFVLEFDSAENKPLWESQKDEPLTAFLLQHFGLDDELQAHILALTLSLDGEVAAGDGLALINRHLTSMGVFGPGFAAVYPKWGGLSEVAQVACRAGAVGGAVYMLDTAVKTVESQLGDASGDQLLQIELSNGITVSAKALVRQSSLHELSVARIAKLIAVVGSPMSHLFVPVVEGAPTPAVAVIGCPAGSVQLSNRVSENSVYVMVHSADSGECPAGQSRFASIQSLLRAILMIS